MGRICFNKFLIIKWSNSKGNENRGNLPPGMWEDVFESHKGYLTQLQKYKWDKKWFHTASAYLYIFIILAQHVILKNHKHFNSIFKEKEDTYKGICVLLCVGRDDRFGKPMTIFTYGRRDHLRFIIGEGKLKSFKALILCLFSHLK